MTNLKNNVSVAGASIGEQHQIFEQKIHEFELAVRDGKSDTEIVEVYTFLRQYAKYHFKAEEKLMSIAHYPDLQLHVDMHDGFLGRLMEMKLDLDSRGSSLELYLSMIEYMKNWHTEHVGGADRAFMEFLEARSGNRSKFQNSDYV